VVAAGAAVVSPAAGAAVVVAVVWPQAVMDKSRAKDSMSRAKVLSVRWFIFSSFFVQGKLGTEVIFEAARRQVFAGSKGVAD